METLRDKLVVSWTKTGMLCSWFAKTCFFAVVIHLSTCITVNIVEKNTHFTPFYKSPVRGSFFFVATFFRELLGNSYDDEMEYEFR